MRTFGGPIGARIIPSGPIFLASILSMPTAIRYLSLKEKIGRAPRMARPGMTAIRNSPFSSEANGIVNRIVPYDG